MIDGEGMVINDKEDMIMMFLFFGVLIAFIVGSVLWFKVL